MRNYFTLAVLVLGAQWLSAQVEQLTPLKYNPRLYFSRVNTMPVNNSRNQTTAGPTDMKYLVDSGYTVVTTDTLQLPFIDDFTVDRTPNYLWRGQHITGTYYNVLAGCLETEGFNTVQGGFISQPSWTYKWDFTHQVVDSFPQQPVQFTFFGNGSSQCFSTTPAIVVYWPAYVRYTGWDSTTGYPTDSVVVGNPDTLNYAPIVNFAKGQPGTLWFDNYAYINNTYPINPPTIGVATLDGLNQYGLPYNNTSTSNYGTADYLTSLPIDVHTYTGADSLYLSFFYEAQGNGDYPDINDSLIVEFKDDGGNWNIVWYDTGYSQQIEVPDTFAQVLINVPQNAGHFNYLGDPGFYTFQFRFRNVAALFGNNNHWNIDYVKLATHRNSADTTVRDQAFVYPFPTILQNYTQESAKQFNYAPDLSDSINILIHNLDPSANTLPPATGFTKNAVEIYPAQQVIAGNTVSFNAGPNEYAEIIPAVEYHIPSTAVDSLVINSQALILPCSSCTDNALTINDTIRHTQTFGSVMAYDDGSAEKAYGLTGLDIKKFAYEFDLNKPDTLVAFQVMFAQIEGYVGDLIFNFEAWDTLQLDSFTFVDSPIYSLANRAPVYVDSTNGFATFVLDTPLIIPSHFYLGWAQTDTRRLQVGYDVNSTLGFKHMFVYTEGKWDSTTADIPGSPMIRLVLGGTYWGHSTYPLSVINLTKDDGTLSVYPNPTNGKVNLSASFAYSTLQVTVMNDIGEVVMSLPAVTNQLDISKLTNGVYLINVTDPETGKIYHNKVVKASF